jgi:hypothetical protein
MAPWRGVLFVGFLEDLGSVLSVAWRLVVRAVASDPHSGGDTLHVANSQRLREAGIGEASDQLQGGEWHALKASMVRALGFISGLNDG